MSIGFVRGIPGGRIGERTLSGVPVSVATFNGKAFPLPSLKVAVECTQEGSGTPSPDNVRAITGYSAINISQSGADTSTPTVHTINLGGTYYVGEYDARTGLLTVTHKYTSKAASNMSVHSTISGRFFGDFGAQNEFELTGNYCNISTNISSSAPANNQFYVQSGFRFQFQTEYTSKEDFVTAMGDTPIVVVGKLVTPQTIQVPPCPLDSLNGVNNIWADTGDITELKYLNLGGVTPSGGANVTLTALKEYKPTGITATEWTSTDETSTINVSSGTYTATAGEYVEVNSTNALQMTMTIPGSYYAFGIKCQVDSSFTPMDRTNWYDCSCILGTELGGTQKDFSIIIDKNGYFAIGYSTASILSTTVSALDGETHTLFVLAMESKIVLVIDGEKAAEVAIVMSGNEMSTLGVFWNNANGATRVSGKIYSLGYYDIVQPEFGYDVPSL